MRGLSFNPGSGWTQLLLAASILTSLQPAAAQSAVVLFPEPPYPLEGRNVTLHVQGDLGKFPFCSWYRGAEISERNRIFNYSPTQTPSQVAGLAYSGRERGLSNCSLHIVALTLNDSGIYILQIPDFSSSRTFEVQLKVYAMSSDGSSMLAVLVSIFTVVALSVVFLGTAWFVYSRLRRAGAHGQSETPIESMTAPSYENSIPAAQKEPAAKLKDALDPTYEVLQHGDQAVYDTLRR